MGYSLKQHIAVIGIGCRFPAADKPDELWQMLCEERSTLPLVSTRRLNNLESLAFRNKITQESASSACAYLDNVDAFDASFFQISPREAVSIDPQCRIGLEVAWEALEDAGLDFQSMENTQRSGLFLGTMHQEYGEILRKNSPHPDLYEITGTSANGMAGRMSRAFGFRGPCLSVDTDRCSSLVAVHLACQSLRSGECPIALAGGVNLILSDQVSEAFSRADLLSPDRSCKFCDRGANGILRAEGAGFVVLKRLEDALEHHDRIYALIRGTAVNHNGAFKGDLLTPNRLAQQEVLEEALRSADCSPYELDYVEAHGTGTPLGDPIEVHALASVMAGMEREEQGRSPLLIGSVKSNIGHTEAAAGIAGLIKTALALRHRKIPASLHCETLNPGIPFESLHVQVVDKLRQWPNTDQAARAGVSSFGLSGTNAHAVLEEAPVESRGIAGAPSVASLQDSYLLPISAKSEAALKDLAARYLDFLECFESVEKASLHDVCYTATVRRTKMPYRLAVFGHSAEELGSHLRIFLEDGCSPAIVYGMADTGLGSGCDVPTGSGNGEDQALLSFRYFAESFVCGNEFPCETLYPFGGNCVSLPCYAWQRERYWPKSDSSSQVSSPGDVSPFASAENNRPANPSSSGHGQWSMLELLVEEIRVVLGLPSDRPFDTSSSFEDLGLSSLMLLELSTAINERLNSSFSVTTFYQYTSPFELADYLTEHCKSVPVSESDVGEQLCIGFQSAVVKEDSETVSESVLRHQVSEASPREFPEPIAIVGIGLRFPGAVNDPGEFWRVLEQGIDCITEAPDSRWKSDALYHPQLGERGCVRSHFGGFVDKVAEFDASFFGISEREAMAIDPRQRILLETAWEALEHAGQSPRQLRGSSTGVFVGMMDNNDYAELKRRAGGLEQIASYEETGNAASVAAGRISYFFGFEGPALVVDTACSSSLVALHLACQSLRSGECTQSLVGGANVLLSPEHSVGLSQAGMLSPGGRCRAFDHSADGYVRAEGSAVLVVKNLSRALSEGNTVYAVIRGTAVNQDGRSNGLTAPNVSSQQKLIGKSCENAGVRPEDIDYVEAHGTGTALGDPIELQALNRALADTAARNSSLLIGSVKTNIGHLEAAAGIAGVIKTALALHHEKIPPSLHLSTKNKHFDWDSANIDVVTELRDWKPSARKRIAAVSSFGFSGTNAQAILQESSDQLEVRDRREGGLPCVLTLSARDAEALRVVVQQYSDYLDSTEECLGDICFTTNVGRNHFDYRLALFGKSVSDLRRKLTSLHPSILAKSVAREEPRIGFWFGDKGTAYGSIGQVLSCMAPVFRETLFKCADLFDRYLPRSLSSVLCSRHGQTTEFADSVYAGPAVFSAGYALAELLASCGIRPSAVWGDGIGQYTAQCVSGSISLTDAVACVMSHSEYSQPRPNSEPLHNLANLGCRVTVNVTASDAQIVRVEDRFRQMREVSGASEVEQLFQCLANLYTTGADIDWEGVYSCANYRRVALPTYPFQRKRFWFSDGKVKGLGAEIKAMPMKGPELIAGQADCLAGISSNTKLPKDPSPQVAVSGSKADSPIERASSIEELLRRELAGLIECDPLTVAKDQNLLDLGLDSLGVVDLLSVVRTELGVTVYPAEFMQWPSIEEFAKYLRAELKSGETGRAVDSIAPVYSQTEIAETAAADGRNENKLLYMKKNPPAVFILSSPRSGSTLLRVMLAGHPELFCPPELSLLPFESLAHAHEQLQRSYMFEGYQRALMELESLSAEQSRERVLDLCRTDISIQEAFHHIQQLALPRLLVDKSPIYTLQPETMRCAEAMFESAKYVHLVRHPYAAMESFERMRIHRILEKMGVLEDTGKDAKDIARDVWTDSNRNVRTFLEGVDRKRWILVKYEDLVGNPKIEIGRITEFLGLTFDDRTLAPYQKLETRMVNGLHPRSLPIGDPNFATRNEIVSSCTNTWKRNQWKPPAISTSHLEVARGLGYALDSGDKSGGKKRKQGEMVSHLLPLRTGANEAPLYCIHPVGGDALVYRTFASLLDEGRAVFGLNSRGIDGKQREYGSIEQMAAAYVNAVRAVQPKGPYHLFGWSMGGRVAVAMAQEMERSGESVGFLGLLDSRERCREGMVSAAFPEVFSLAWDFLLAYGSSLAASLYRLSAEQISSLSSTLKCCAPAEREDFLIDWAVERRLLPADVDRTEVRHRTKLVRDHVDLLKKHKLRRIDSTIHIWWALDEKDPPNIGWNSVTRGEVKVDFADGNHFELLVKPYVNSLAEKVAKQLRTLPRGGLGDVIGY